MTEQENLLEILKSPEDPDKEVTEEERKAKQEEIAKKRAAISSLRADLKLTAMNRNLSSHFEFIPSPGPNRKMRRSIKQLRRRGGKQQRATGNKTGRRG